MSADQACCLGTSCSGASGREAECEGQDEEWITMAVDHGVKLKLCVKKISQHLEVTTLID